MSRPTIPPAAVVPAQALVSDGQSNWSIVIGAQASEAERHAADELRDFLAAISGAKLPIRDDSTAQAAPEIWVGCSRRWEHLELALRGAPGAEGFILLTGPDYLLIAGESRRGALYGVYAFLEQHLGCRWYTATVSRLPARRDIRLGAIDYRDAPALEYREPFAFESLDPDWAARNRCNGNFPPLVAKHGGGVRYSTPFVHTFDTLVPVVAHFDSHPEYFSEVNGVRLRENTQLCLSHPDVFALALGRIRAWLRASPEVSIVSVSQNDWENPCQCAACRAIDVHEGNFSGSLIHFVNRIAAAIEVDHPHVAIDTLAYQYTRKAPRHVRPRPNVIVRLCSIECCFAHPLATCSEKMLLKKSHGAGATFAEDLAAWGRICDRLYVWDYVTNFANYVLPFPNLGVLAANVRLFAQHHVRGLFAQGANPPGGGGEWAELRAWVLAKLMWNPQEDAPALMREFMLGVYGPGGAHLLRYVDALNRLVTESNLHASIYDRPDSPYLTPELLALADDCFDRAEAVAPDAATCARIRRARLPIRFAQLAALPLGAPGRLLQISTFATDASAAGIAQLSEHIPMERTIAYLRDGIHLTHFARYEGGWSPFDNPWPCGAKDNSESSTPGANSQE